MIYLSAKLQGTGGTFKASEDDFVVEELPAYLPCGQGGHTFVFVEKRGLNTRDAVLCLCQAFDRRDSEVGTAGMKDRHAVTRQWISLPQLPPEEARGKEFSYRGGTLRILAAERHKNKLRTGHLRGNRFVLTLRNTIQGVERAEAILRLLSTTGVQNRYGEQRFGNHGKNHEDGRALVTGSLRITDRNRRRFLISAYQSALFNEYLDRRAQDGLLFSVLPGDVLQKVDTGGIFTVPTGDPGALAEAQERLSKGLLLVTGPMFGSKMREPAPLSESLAREEEILAKEGLTKDHFATLGALAEGTRRPLLCKLDLDEDAVRPCASDADAVEVRFSLPAGAYATEVLRELMKSERHGVGEEEIQHEVGGLEMG